MEKVREYHSDIYIERQGKNLVRLLQVSKEKVTLKNLRSDEGEVGSIINCSFFHPDKGYVLGRNQGDMKGDTHPDNQGYLDVVIKKDGTYKAGELNSWDYTDYKNIAVGFSPAAILINEGKDVEEVSKPFYSKANLGVVNPQTAFIILKGGEAVQMVVDGRSASSRGMTAYEVREFVRKKFPNVDILAICDGGGSSEMVINGNTVNKVSDGASRSMLNGIAFIKHKRPVTETSTKGAPMFLQRLLIDGMKDNKFYYNQNENPYADAETGLPNCVCYAMGRSSELAGKSVRYDLLDRERKGLGHGMYPDAQLWYPRAHWKKGSEPKIGAILVWGGGRWGHVAIVEEILPNGSLIISQSNYQREIFQMMTIEKPIVGRVTKGIGLKFLGYIYNPYVIDGRDIRNPRINQVEILVTQMKARDDKNNWHEGRYVPKGLYDILDRRKATINNTVYEMAKLDTNVWVALNDKAGWTKTYLAVKEEVKPAIGAPMPEKPKESKHELEVQLEESKEREKKSLALIEQLKAEVITRNKEQELITKKLEEVSALYEIEKKKISELKNKIKEALDG